MDSISQGSIAQKICQSTSPLMFLNTKSNATTNGIQKAISNQQINVLLLENINITAIDIFKSADYQVESLNKALPEEELINKIKNVHVLGIRSKTKLTAKVLEAAENLLAIGCFCIGTNQVDLEYASQRAITVFNSPFSNSRSVAELVLAEIIFLARQLGDRNNEVHRGVWNKVSNKCYEVRGKKLGIVGYGHIGSQLSVLAEALGMQVFFYDVLALMPLGSARAVSTLKELLTTVDFVSFHVPETDDTKNMVGEEEIRAMRPGSYLINASRGTVVQIAPLAKALRDGHLGGAAVDVYPSEPARNGEGFESDLIGCPNTILSPHVGGSTEEAQSLIGIEVGNAITKFLAKGSSLGAVNFPQVELRPSLAPSSVRVAFAHNNVPGVLKSINNVLSEYNVERQTTESKGSLAYLVADVVLNSADEAETIPLLSNLYNQISSLPHGISTRLIK